MTLQGSKGVSRPSFMPIGLLAEEECKYIHSQTDTHTDSYVIEISWIFSYKVQDRHRLLVLELVSICSPILPHLPLSLSLHTSPVCCFIGVPSLWFEHLNLWSVFRLQRFIALSRLWFTGKLGLFCRV